MLPIPCFIMSFEALTFENVRYGMLVIVLDKDGGSYHSGCKVHFYNRKGVLVGNYYEFLPYERLKLRHTDMIQYPRYFYKDEFEKIKSFLFRIPLRIIDVLIRLTESKMD